MGTILQSLAQRQDGLLLLESFESPDFTLDQGWSVLNGVPSISANATKDGLYSLILDSTCPLIQNGLSSHFKYAAVWFFDDVTKTTQGATPAMVLRDSNTGLTFGVGVNNACSTDHYSVLQDSGAWIATGIPRSAGWHRLSMSPGSNGLPRMWIDGTDTTFSSGTGTSPFFNQIQIGCQGNTGNGWGYMDWVQVCLTSTLTVYNLTDPQGLVLVCAGNAPQGVSSGGVASIDMATVDSPVDGYLVVTQVMVSNSAPFYQSDIINVSAGDVYFLNQYRFGRRPSTMNIVPTQSRTDTLAVDGPKQSVFFFDVDKVTLTFQDIDECQKDALLAWWTTAKRGEFFSVAVEENDIYLDATQQAVTAFPIGQIVVAYAPPGIGKVLTVQSPDGTIKENVTVAGATYDVPSGLWTVTLKYPQAEAVTAGLQVRARYYWPFCTAASTQLAVALSSPKVKRWTAQISFDETVQAQDFMSFLAGLQP